MDQQLSSAAQNLENVVCKGLGLAQPSAILRNIKVKALKTGMQEPFPEENYSQAIRHLQSLAPDPRAFDRQVEKLEARGTRGLKEFVGLLHVLATDSVLTALVKGPFSTDAARHTHAIPRPAASTQSATAGATAAAATVTVADGMHASHQPSVSGLTGASRASQPGPAPSLPVQPSTGMASSTQPTLRPGTGTVLGAPHVSSARPTAEVSGQSAMQSDVPSQRLATSARQGSTSTSALPCTQPAASNAPATASHVQSTASHVHQQQVHASMAAPRVHAAGSHAPAAVPHTLAALSQAHAAGTPPHASMAALQFSGSVPEALAGGSRSPSARPSTTKRTPAHDPNSTAAQLNAILGQFPGETQLPGPRFQEPPRPAVGAASTAARLPMANPAAPLPQVPAPGGLFSLENDMGFQDDGGTRMTDAVIDLLDSLPGWNTARPHLTGLDLVMAAQQRAQRGPGQQVPGLAAGAQESIVINDLLYAFMGVDGVHVGATLVGPQGGSGTQGPALAFGVRPCLEPSSQELVERLTPLCEYVAVLQRFIETRSAYGHGLVSHAVCAAMRHLLSDWQLVVTQLEHQQRTGRLTLQSMVFYCQGPLTSLGLVARVAAEAASSGLTSAGLLNLLASKVSALAGDQAGRAIMQRLMQAATVPYFRLLERWLCEGVLDDPYGEFMIQENKSVGQDALTRQGDLAYWSQRYTVRQHTPKGGEPHPDVPDFLAGMADKILTTGKYLNAMRECGQAPARLLPPGTRLAHTTQSSIGATIHTAHAAASSALLQLLMHQQDLMGWLRSLKHFFLLDQGDVVVHLAEAARDELAAPATQISRPRLQSLLELALRTSSLAQDAHAEALQLDLEPRSLPELARAAGVVPTPASTSEGGAGVPALRLGEPRRGVEEVAGWEVLLLTVRLSWPMTLVVPPRAMARYQLIFRHLFQMKHAERQLAAAWHRMQGARNAARLGRDGLRGAYALAQRHLFLVQELLRYSTMDVLEPAWRAMEERVRRAEDVDEVISSHAQFLSVAVDGLLLSQPNLLRPLLALQQGALLFSSRLVAAWDTLDRQQPVKAPSQGGSSGARSGPGAPTGRGSASGRPSTSGAGAPAARASGSGAEPGPGISARRESRLEMWSQSGPGTATAQLDVAGLAAQFSSGLRELQEGLQELYRSAMRREGAADSNAAPQSLETREEVEALLGLMQRLQMEGPSGEAAEPGGSSVAGNTSTAALYKQLAAQAAAYA